MCMNERGISNDNLSFKSGFCYAMLILFWHRPSTVNPGGQYLFHGTQHKLTQPGNRACFIFILTPCHDLDCNIVEVVSQ